jgi:hypothetical protein
MQIDVFDTTELKNLVALKALLARDGKDITLEHIYTTGGTSGTGSYYHWVTVTYLTLEQAPPQI